MLKFNSELTAVSLATAIAVALLVSLSGCAEGSPDAPSIDEFDDEHSSFVAALDEQETSASTDRSDALSAEERGVLELVNTASFETLDSDVGLDVRAATNIVDYRNGDDGVAGTDDDRTFQSFDELDQIPWVGPYAFEQLLTYARDNDYIDGEDGEVHDIAIGSPEEAGVLHVANEAGLVELDEKVRLDVRAATNIVDYRTGEDDTPGTDKDNPIESLGELDQISWVGPYAFQQLLDYAINTGIIDGGEPAEIHGITVGSNEAIGVLQLANEGSFSTLDEDVGLDVRAATNIVETREQQTIETLVQLDDISWVAQRAFGKLLDYAHDHQYVPAENWRGTFETGAVDVELEVTGGTCYESKYSTTYDNRGNYYWYCYICNSSRSFTNYDFPVIRIHGENPGTLHAEYTDDEGKTWTDTVSADGQFTLNLVDQAGGWYDVDKRGFEGQLKPDFAHQVSYEYAQGDLDISVYASRDEKDCDLTYEPASH